MAFKKIIGVFLLGTTMLVEMYFQNREVEIMRSMAGFIAEETIDILSENIEYRDYHMVSKDKGGFIELEKFGERNKEHVADLRMCNYEGETMMHSAARKGQIEVVKYLLEVGKEVDIRTREVLNNSSILYRDTRQTPLHYAAASGKVEVMRLLLEYGADISAKTENGDTPLHKAALHGQTSAVRWLLEQGADLEAKNLFGATPLSMALINQRKEAAVVLLGQSSCKDLHLMVSPWFIMEAGKSFMMLLLLEAFMLLMLRVINS